jgi:glycosyltransferase involved in cell wall biosynthesis
VHTIATDAARAPGARPQRPVRADEVHPAVASGNLGLYPTRFPRRLLYSPELARAVRASVLGADVVHIHSLWLHPQYAAARAAASAGVPYIVSPHGSLDPALASRGRVRKALTMHVWQRRMLEGASLIHATTDVEADLLPDAARAAPLAVVPVGIDLDEFRELPHRDVFRRERLGSYDGPLILFLSRLSYKKRLDVLIEAFARLRSELDCRLVIAGPDDERLTPSLQAVAARAGVKDQVMFVGPAFGEDRRAALASADVWALSSQTENFGIAVVEALAAGCPVVISPAVNLAPLLTAAGAGIVADLAPDAFATALRAVLTDSALRDRLRWNGPALASRFDIRAVGSALEEMYLRALQR